MTLGKFQLIGLSEIVSFPEAAIKHVPAKIDTGAYRCSVWATQIKETEDGLSFVLFDKRAPYYNGRTVLLKNFEKAKIRNSFGHEEERYRVWLKIKVGRKIYKADFTLANRSINHYPVLIGRSLLKGRFVVDVSKNNVHFYK